MALLLAYFSDSCPQRYWGNEAEWRVHRDGLMRMIEARGGIIGLDGNWRLELAAFLYVPRCPASPSKKPWPFGIYHPGSLNPWCLPGSLNPWCLVCRHPLTNNTLATSVSLMAKPSWFDGSNQLWELSQISRNHSMLNEQKLQRVRGLWLISFIQDIRTLRSSAAKLREYALPLYTAIQDALKLLNMDSQRDASSSSSPEAACTDHELARTSCLLLISVILHGTLTSCEISPSPAPCSLSGLDKYLHERRLEWQDSVEGLYGLLFLDLTASPESAQTLNYIQQMAHVLVSLQQRSTQGGREVFGVHTPSDR